MPISQLPLAFLFWLVLCCGEALPARFLKSKVKAGVLAGITVMLVVFAVSLWNNMSEADIIKRNPTLSRLARAAGTDPFEWPDYMLTYVVNTMSPDIDDEVRQQADEYALRLSQLDSNLTPRYLADYYLSTGHVGQGIKMMVKYVTYVFANPDSYQSAFDILARYETDDEVYRAGVAQIKQLMDAWNAENMGELRGDEGIQAFLARVLG